jgi:hypothetical protein
VLLSEIPQVLTPACRCFRHQSNRVSVIYGASPYNYGIRMATPILPAEIKDWESATGLHRHACYAAHGLLDEPGRYKERDLEVLEGKLSRPIHYIQSL